MQADNSDSDDEFDKTLAVMSRRPSERIKDKVQDDDADDFFETTEVVENAINEEDNPRFILKV